MSTCAQAGHAASIGRDSGRMGAGRDGDGELRRELTSSSTVLDDHCGQPRKLNITQSSEMKHHLAWMVGRVDGATERVNVWRRKGGAELGSLSSRSGLPPSSLTRLPTARLIVTDIKIKQYGSMLRLLHFIPNHFEAKKFLFASSTFEILPSFPVSGRIPSPNTWNAYAESIHWSQSQEMKITDRARGRTENGDGRG